MLPIFFFPSLFVGVIPEPVHDVGSLQGGVGDEVLVLQPSLRPVRRLHLFLAVLHKVERDRSNLTLGFALSLIPGNARLEKKLCLDFTQIHTGLWTLDRHLIVEEDVVVQLALHRPLPSVQ